MKYEYHGIIINKNNHDDRKLIKTTAESFEEAYKDIKKHVLYFEELVEVARRDW